MDVSKNRFTFDIQINAINETDNPTKKEVTFILHGFDVSHNYAFIAKETAEKALPSLKGMPIVAHYKEKTSVDANDDSLGSHEVEFSRDRETGEPIVSMGTVPIGVFTEDAYITTITDKDGNEKEVVAGNGILWASRFPNVVGLLKEWVDEGITVVSSMEILYDSYKVEDGITEILNYFYEGHCVLNSQDRGEGREKVYPAYDESRLTKLVAEAVNQDKKEDGKMPKFKKVYELSHSDIRSLLYTQLESHLSEGEYSWITDVYETYFVANIYKYNSETDELEYDKYYKFDYTKGENDAISINGESKVEVQLKRDWVETTQFEQLQNEVNEKQEKLDELKSKFSELELKSKTLATEKESLEKQFNDASEKVVSLSSQVEELQPFKEKFEKVEFEKSLSEKKEFYSAKFEALNALEKFEEESVQELIEKAVFDNDEGKQATLQLNSILVDMVEVKEKVKDGEPVIREVSSKRENLVEHEDDFDSRYGL